MQNRSLAFRLTAIAITISMLTSPSMAVAPTVWQYGGPGYGYLPPRPYLAMGPFPPLPLPRFFAPPAPWAYPQPVYTSYASYGYDGCCASPVRYAPSSCAPDYGNTNSVNYFPQASCSGCATGCSSCTSGYSTGFGGVVMDSCCGGVTVQPASSSTTIEPEVDPDSDRKFRGLDDDDSSYEPGQDPMTGDGFGRSDRDPDAGEGADNFGNDEGGRFRDFERGLNNLEDNSSRPGSRGVPRPSESGLGGDGFESGLDGLGGTGADESGLGGSSPGGAPDATTSPADNTTRPGTFRRRTPDTMPEFGDPAGSSGDAPMFEMGETGDTTTHSTSRPPTTPLEAGEAESDASTNSESDSDGTIFPPPVMNDQAEADGTAPASSGAVPGSESGSAGTEVPTSGSEDDASGSSDADASERSPEVRASFRMTPVILPVSRSGANSLLAPRRLATQRPTQPATLTTLKQKPDAVRTSDRHPSTDRRPIRWISLPGDDSRVLR